MLTADRFIHVYSPQVGRLSELEAELSSVTLKLQWLEADKSKLLREAEDRNNKVTTHNPPK